MLHALRPALAPAVAHAAHRRHPVARVRRPAARRVEDLLERRVGRRAGRRVQLGPKRLRKWLLDGRARRERRREPGPVAGVLGERAGRRRRRRQQARPVGHDAVPLVAVRLLGRDQLAVALVVVDPERARPGRRAAVEQVEQEREGREREERRPRRAQARPADGVERADGRLDDHGLRERAQGSLGPRDERAGGVADDGQGGRDGARRRRRARPGGSSRARAPSRRFDPFPSARYQLQSSKKTPVSSRRPGASNGIGVAGIRRAQRELCEGWAGRSPAAADDLSPRVSALRAATSCELSPDDHDRPTTARKLALTDAPQSSRAD